MAYVYCRQCGAGQDTPDFKSCVQGFIECHTCGEEIPLGKDECVDALVQLEERITQLELLVNK